jgi:hypothetical protein
MSLSISLPCVLSVSILSSSISTFTKRPANSRI